jgi:hypothetical protein
MESCDLSRDRLNEALDIRNSELQIGGVRARGFPR